MTFNENPPKRSSWRARLVVRILLGLVAIALAVWSATQWSLIGVDVDERIAEGWWAEEALDFNVLKLESGRELTIDAGLMARLGGRDGVEGKRIRTERWERTATYDGSPVHLQVSSMGWRVIATLAALLTLASIRQLSGRRGDRRRGSISER